MNSIVSGSGPAPQLSGHEGPVAGKRIEGFDLARAFAFCGMVVVNFKLVLGAAESGPGWLVSLAGLVDGRAVATFVMLAGVGISLLSRRARTSNPAELPAIRRRLHRRALFLFLVGLLYTPLWPADILHFYGIYLVLGTYLLTASSRRLWLVATSLVVTFPLLLVIFDYEKGWDWETLTYSGFWTIDGFLRHLFFNGFHPVIPWAAFLLVGVWLGRQDLSRKEVRRRLLFFGVLIAVIMEGASRWILSVLNGLALTAKELEDLQALLGTAPMPPMPQYLLAAGATAMVWIVICVAVAEQFRGSPWLKPLVATGQMALTLYVAHVVVGMGTLEALGRLENQTLAFALGSSAVFCAGAILFAYFWRQRFARGPLEWAMRRVTD